MALGWPSVAWGLKNISSREIAEWIAYDKIEPFGDRRADLRMAINASSIVNTLLKMFVKRPKLIKLDKFIPKFIKQRKQRKTDAQLLEIAEALNKAFGGADLREKK